MERDYRINELISAFLLENDKRPSAIADKAGIRRDTFSKIIHNKRPIFADELIPIINAAGMDLSEVVNAVSAN